MENRKIVCTILTPLFSYGAYKNEPEFRNSELKGAMRYVYRIICPTSNAEGLRRDEMELFGGTAGQKGADSSHMSPIRICIYGSAVKGYERILQHKWDKKPCFLKGDFEIVIRLKPFQGKRSPDYIRKADIDWYEDLIKLSLIFCGMGERSRKGKGCFKIRGLDFASKKQALEWICNVMNKVAEMSLEKHQMSYKIENGKIISAINLQKLNHPVVEKIELGEKIEQDGLKNYLYAVDKSSHYAKKEENENRRDRSVIKAAEKKCATGYGSPKFASPLFIRLIQIGKDYFPLYIFIKGVIRGTFMTEGRRVNLRNRDSKVTMIDDCYINREEFIHRIENGMG